MSKGRSSELVQSWIDKLGGEFRIAEPHGARQETAYAQWFDQQAAAPRRSARAPRRGDPSSPPSAVVRAGHRSFTHDRSHVRAGRPARGVLIQSIPIGFVTALVTAGLLGSFSSTIRTQTRSAASRRPRWIGRSRSLITGAPPHATSAASPFLRFLPKNMCHRLRHFQ
jgi:hypothetical protein